MMESVVSGGTGTAAQIPGVRVAGKTGTAETGRAGRNTAWFVAFAPVDKPQVAIAVVLQNQSGDRRHRRSPDREADHAGALARAVELRIVRSEPWLLPTP